jgi:hypothetical protein
MPLGFRISSARPARRKSLRHNDLHQSQIFFKFPIDSGRYYGRMIEVTGMINTREKRTNYEEVYVCA